jgi:hypothetical protein
MLVAAFLFGPMSPFIFIILLIAIIRVLKRGILCGPIPVIGVIVLTIYIAAKTAAGDFRNPWVPWSTWSFAQIQGSGIAATRVEKLGNFSDVDVTGPILVEVVIGPSSMVQVDGDSNIVGLVRTVSRDGALRVYLDTDRSISQKIPINIRVTCPAIAEARAARAAQISIAQADAQPLRLHAQTGANIESSGNLTNLEVSAESSSQIHCNGSAQTVTASASSGATLDLEHLDAQQVRVSVASASHANLAALDTLDVNAREGSSVRGEGHVKTLKVAASTGSSVRLDQLAATDADVEVTTGSSVEVNVTDSITGSADTGSSIVMRGNPRSNQFSKDMSSSIR